MTSTKAFDAVMATLDARGNREVSIKTGEARLARLKPSKNDEANVVDYSYFYTGPEKKTSTMTSNTDDLYREALARLEALNPDKRSMEQREVDDEMKHESEQVAKAVDAAKVIGILMAIAMVVSVALFSGFSYASDLAKSQLVTRCLDTDRTAQDCATLAK